MVLFKIKLYSESEAVWEPGFNKEENRIFAQVVGADGCCPVSLILVWSCQSPLVSTSPLGRLALITESRRTVLKEG